MASPKKAAAAAPKEGNVQIRMLTDAKVKDVDVKSNAVVETDTATAKSLVKSGVADDTAEAVEYALSQDGVEVIVA